jgi:hypothetical protein
MRNKEFATTFWQNAHNSLPAAVRARHMVDMQTAERWELRVGAVIEAYARLKAAFVRSTATPTRAAS